MHLGWHAMTAGVMTLVQKEQLVPVVMGQVGVDIIDHGLWALINVRPLSVKNIKRTLDGLYKKSEGQLYFFHTIEVWLILMWLGKNWWWGRWFLMAYSLHLLMDGYWYVKKTKNWQWLKKWSLIWWCLNINRKRKN